MNSVSSHSGTLHHPARRERTTSRLATKGDTEEQPAFAGDDRVRIVHAKTSADG